MLLSTGFVAKTASSKAAIDLPEICEVAAAQAARATGVPISVLRAISLNETGRKHDGRFRPWPWTVNMEGKGVWFDTPEEAQAYVDKNFQRGARSFDVGCFQLNYKWHGQAFASIKEMFDPTANALYAANFLTELYREKGDWTQAAGAYHSRTPKFADRYAKRFDKLRARLGPVETQTDAPSPIAKVAMGESKPATDTSRINTFPLLQQGFGQPASLGSLVPSGAGVGGPRLIGGS